MNYQKEIDELQIEIDELQKKIQGRLNIIMVLKNRSNENQFLEIPIDIESPVTEQKLPNTSRGKKELFQNVPLKIVERISKTLEETFSFPIQNKDHLALKFHSQLVRTIPEQTRIVFGTSWKESLVLEAKNPHHQ